MKKIIAFAFVMLNNHASEPANTNLSLLETHRLILRHTTTQDRHVFKTIVTSDAQVCKHLFGAEVSQEHMIEKLKTLKIRLGLYLSFFVRNKRIPFFGISNRWIILDKEHNSEPIGFIGLKDADSATRHLLLSDNYKNFSIFLKREAHSKGYVKEITQTLIPAIMSHKDYQDVDGLCFLVSPENTNVLRCLINEDGSPKNGLSDLGTINLDRATAMNPEPLKARMFTITRQNVIQQIHNN